jgi:endogenous inhibitor of DNA gyrase (YacG/DUF329 family)
LQSNVSDWGVKWEFGPEETKESAMSEMICPQCKKPFRQGKHNQRFCNPQCKDDFHNAEKMIAYRLRKSEEAEERREARLAGVNGNGNEHKPLSEILHLKPDTLPKLEPSFKRRAW